MPRAQVQLPLSGVMATKVYQQISFKIEQHEPGLSSGHSTELKSPKRIQNKVIKAFAEPMWKSWKFQPKPKYFEQIYLDLRSYHEKLSGKASNQLKSFYSRLLKSP